MNERNLKIIFFSLSFLMLVALLVISRDAGISGDEEVHYLHSEDVYDYYASMGKDQDALSTPKTYLQYYGQSPDNMATIMIHWFGIKNIYGFRHLFSSFLGWLAIFISALFARWLKGYGAAILTLILFAVSPRFLGHLQNNLKDIPFALAYIAGVYYILKLTYTKFKSQTSLTISFLIASIAFSVSIRAGGILLIFYLLFAAFLYYLLEYIHKKKLDWEQVRRTILLLLIISSAGYLIGLLLWPYALQNAFVNPWKSYLIMAHFPTTIQQIFEGRFIWSDYHPWYYLPKYMLITIPLVVLLGILLFLIFARSIVEPERRFTYGFLVFSILLPPAYVIVTSSNLYGAWRHFIFIYPGIVIFSAVGFHGFWERIKRIPIKIVSIIVFVLFSIHPLKFMAASHPYYYLYYNQFVGGLKGAYGRYETDYYYHTMRGGAEWLKKYLDERGIRRNVLVGSNFPAGWYFRDRDNFRFRYFPYQQRNDYDWDYAIIGNSYINPEQLRNKNFPPEGTIHVVMVEGVPMCAVVERKSKLPFIAEQAYEAEDYRTAIDNYRDALIFYQKDEHIYYKLAMSLSLLGEDSEALAALKKASEINGEYEPVLFLSGQLMMNKGDNDAAKASFEKLIHVNRKYFNAYVGLAEISQKEGKLEESRETLKACLRINPRYKPAIIALGKTYKDTDPSIAEKYYEQANSIVK